MCATERVVPQFKYATEGKHDQRREQSEDGNVSALREDRLGNQQGNTGFGVADTILTVAKRQRHRGPRSDALGFCRSPIADMPSTSVPDKGVLAEILCIYLLFGLMRHSSAHILRLS